MKKIVVIISMIILNSAYSQVGINTQNPRGIFHIDGNKNNPSTGDPSASQQKDDFIVLSSGNVGIGTATPSRKLEINSGGTAGNPIDGFRLTDGRQAKNKALISDENGSAHWEYIALKSYKGNIADGFDLSLNNSSYNFNSSDLSTGFYATTSYIDLAPGNWQVNISLLLAYDNISGTSTLTRDDWFWTRVTLTDAPVSAKGSGPYAPTADLDETKFLGNIFNGPAPTGGVPKYAMINGALMLNNSSSNTKRYYIIIGGVTRSSAGLPGRLKNVGGMWGENVISAFAVQ
ncbi:hypothetical protein [Chryseobacterium gambrini]|uniref:hypothetical protein n=1 Tax=Chryseobacterium gambrini TaxID=373672 RepID=UPI0022F17CB7|nr:hypothetical protein [Chryseobacterium gambrini]WBV53814.1 hypothetical protein PFY09_05705 [Chryseobacterium gambrini]